MNRIWLAGALGAALIAACGGDDQPAGLGGTGTDSGSSDGNASDGTVGADAQNDSTTGDGPQDGGTVADVITDVSVGRDSEGGDNMPDAKPEDDALFPDTGGCGVKTGYSNAGDGGAGSCGIGQTYTCMGDNYQIDCQCPAAGCTCKKNGNAIGTLLLYGGCPGCAAPDFGLLAGDCLIPY